MIFEIKYEYSKKEMELIKWYKFLDIYERLSPPELYRLMAEKAFLDDDRTAYSDSLRRCLRALNTGNIKRLTPEWDELI
jgi:hypothetical protein